MMSDFDLQDQIELLVEDELSVNDKRDLLEQLEQDPQLWRQVGLAFLEHQKIRSKVRATVKEDRVLGQPVPPLRVASLEHEPSDSARISWKHILTLTACMLIAFVVGRAVPTSPQQPLTRKFTPKPSAQAPATPETTSSLSPESEPDNEYRIVGSVQWNSNSGVHISPVFDGIPNEKWLIEHPPSVDEEILRSFSRAGWQIKPKRRLISMKLTSGDQYTIPIDDVTYKFVGLQIL